MKSVLVTGGAGFIGSALIWALNERGVEDIVVSDLLGEGDKYRNLVPLRFSDYIEADDLLNAVADDEPWLRGFSCIFHLGACSATTEKDCRYLIKNNYETSKVLAGWAVRHGIRFVYASSAATYGDGGQGMEDTAEGIEQLRPLNMYGYSKHLFDLYARRQGWLEKIAGLKYFNVFGPNEDHKGDMRSVVHKAFAQIRETGSVKLFKSYHPDYPDGGQKRDFLYVKDAVRMTLHLAERGDAHGLFNLGSGEAHTWIELVSPLFEALGKPVNIEFIEMPETLRGKYQYYTCADISRLRAAGYGERVTPLADAVRDYARNHLIPGAPLGW